MPEIDTGNTAWLLVSSALVLLMTPGLALFYGGLNRSKGVLNMMMMSIATIGLVSVLWLFYGFSVAFGSDTAAGLIGNLGDYFGGETFLAETDLWGTTGIPTYVSTLSLIGNAHAQQASGMGLQPGAGDTAGPEFRIPANAQDHIESMRFALPAATPEYRLWTVASHMHYVGTDMRIGITRAAAGSEPAEECLLETPKWDFNWQRGYQYDVPIDQAPTVKAGDVLNLRCTYDNSSRNSFVQNALAEQGLTEPRDVVLGEETLDEMCLGVFGLAQKVSDLLQ